MRCARIRFSPQLTVVFEAYSFVSAVIVKAMKIIKCLILALILRAGSYQAQIVVPKSRPNRSTFLVEDLVQIITSCYKDQIKGVGLAGNLPDSLSKKLSAQLIPVTLMDDSNHMIGGKTIHLADRRRLYKLQVFIVGASSQQQLSTVLQFIIKSTIWWNPMASFFILDQSRGCDDGVNFLGVAWFVGILNAKVICLPDIKHGSYIFNFNPFTSQAPDAWRQLGVYNLPNNHPFTVFGQEYKNDDAICVDLEFVKTKNLGGYKIRVEGSREEFKRLRNMDRGKWINSVRWAIERERILNILYSALNVTPKYSGVNRHVVPYYIEMNIRYSLAQSENFSTTYPYQQFGVILVSKFRGHKSQLEKILDVIDFDSRIGMGIVYLVTFIFFKFFVHQALGPTFLNLIRITSNTGFANLPVNSAPRLYLTGLLFFVVTMQGIYQGSLASLLTTNIPVRNINSFKDFVYFGYNKIYGVAVCYDFIEDADLQNSFEEVGDVTTCIKRMLNDSKAVCLDFAVGEIFDIARLYDLHLSREFVRQVPAGFNIQKSWYLEEQLNIILGKIMEADIFETWEVKCNPTTLDDFQFDKEVRSNKDFKKMELFELGFAFIILGIGLLFATVAFIIEVAIYRYQQRKNNRIIVL